MERCKQFHLNKDQADLYITKFCTDVGHMDIDELNKGIAVINAILYISFYNPVYGLEEFLSPNDNRYYVGFLRRMQNELANQYEYSSM